MSKIQVAIVGLGYWGPNLLRNFLTISDVEVIWICDTSKKQLEQQQNIFPHINVTSNIQDILSDSSIDLVVVATPLKTHFPLAKQVLMANKHVLVEKPFTHSSKEAMYLIDLAKKQNKQIFVGHTFVYSEPIKYLKGKIESDSLGKIYYFDSTRVNLGLLQSDTNVLWDLVPHDLSIILFLFKQKPLTVQAIGSSFLRKNVEELVHVFIELEDNISCHIMLSWLSPVKIRNIVIGGSKKMLSFNDIEPTEKIKIYDKGVSFKKNSVTPFSPAYRSGEIKIPRIEQKEALHSELSHFIKCIKKNTKSHTGGDEGLEVIKIIEALEKSLITGKKIILYNA